MTAAQMVEDIKKCRVDADYPSLSEKDAQAAVKDLVKAYPAVWRQGLASAFDADDKYCTISFLVSEDPERKIALVKVHDASTNKNKLHASAVEYVKKNDSSVPVITIPCGRWVPVARDPTLLCDKNFKTSGGSRSTGDVLSKYEEIMEREMEEYYKTKSKINTSSLTTSSDESEFADKRRPDSEEYIMTKIKIWNCCQSIDYFQAKIDIMKERIVLLQELVAKFDQIDPTLANTWHKAYVEEMVKRGGQSNHLKEGELEDRVRRVSTAAECGGPFEDRSMEEIKKSLEEVMDRFNNLSIV